MQVTIKDVAKEIGVSTSTVSRVLTGSSNISDKTKNKVMAAVKRLNYYPNPFAKSLLNSTSNALGLVLPSREEDVVKNQFFIQLMSGISIYAQNNGYSILYNFSENKLDEMQIIQKFIDTKRVDGIILLTSKQGDKAIEYLSKAAFPFVVIGRPDKEKDILWVNNDNVKSMYETVEYLIEMGFTDIAFIGGDEIFNVSKDRLNGYRKCLEDNKIPINEKQIIQMKEINESEGYKAANILFEYSVPEAIVCTDDLFAFGVNRAIKNYKIKNIALIGFNNTPLAEHQTPSLTSVDINSYLLGYESSKLLIEKLKNVNLEYNNHIIDTMLIKRESTKIKRKA